MDNFKNIFDLYITDSTTPKTHLANIPLYYQFKKDDITAPPASIKDMYMDNFKNIFDLYITDSTTPKTQLSSKTGDDASSEFALGKAAFYQNGTWAWSRRPEMTQARSSRSARPRSTRTAPGPGATCRRPA